MAFCPHAAAAAQPSATAPAATTAATTASVPEGGVSPGPEAALASFNACPLGPGSLTWDAFGQVWMLLGFFRLGLIQNMHPAVSRALEEHSGEVFLKNPWNRLLRSIPPILGVVYDPDAGGTGRQVRDFHVRIQGHLHTGEAYHALAPDIFYWTHATFFDSVILCREYFGTPFTEVEKEQLYRESITWYSRYGVSMRPVPPDYASFKRYWAGMIAGLQATPMTDFALKMHRTARPFQAIPAPVWWVIDPLINSLSLWLARGTLPPSARATLGWTWSAWDAWRLRAFCGIVKRVIAVLPERWRYLPRAHAGIVAARAAQAQTARSEHAAN